MTTSTDEYQDVLIITARIPKTLVTSVLLPVAVAAVLADGPHGMRLSVEVTLRPEHYVEATLPEHMDPAPVGPGVLISQPTIIATTSVGTIAQPFQWSQP